MAPGNKTSTLDLSYLAVILLLAYLLTSAPKYVRQFRESHNNIKIERSYPFREVLKIGKAYTIDPYIRAFNSLRPAETPIASR
jgi:hypothetical protein